MDGKRSDRGLIGGDVVWPGDPGGVGQVVGGDGRGGHVVEVVVYLVSHSGQRLDHHWLGGVGNSRYRSTHDRYRGTHNRYWRVCSWKDSFSHWVEMISVVGEHFGRFGVDYFTYCEWVEICWRYRSV